MISMISGDRWRHQWVKFAPTRHAILLFRSSKTISPTCLGGFENTPPPTVARLEMKVKINRLWRSAILNDCIPVTEYTIAKAATINKGCSPLLPTATRMRYAPCETRGPESNPRGRVTCKATLTTAPPRHSHLAIPKSNMRPLWLKRPSESSQEFFLF